MSLLAPAASVERPAFSSGLLGQLGTAWRALATPLEHVLVGASMLWWVLPLTRGAGGRDPHLLSIALILMVAALLTARPWHHVRLRELATVGSLVAAAFVVCLTAPTGWKGANDLGAWAYAGGSYLLVRAYTRSVVRVLALVAVFALAGLDQFASSWLPWWGGGDPSVAMTGTFYWHNQFAAFLLAPALLGVALAVWPRRPVAILGWFVAPLCSAGVLYSTSRATLGLLLLGWVAVGLLVVTRHRSRSAITRLFAVGALTVGTAFVLTGPPFFAHRSMPSAAVESRSQQESASGNAAWRTQEWREAAQVYAAYPVTGTGFHGFGSASASIAPRAPHSAFAHNAWLQTLAEGGTLLGIPFLLASLAAALALILRLLRNLRHPADPIGSVVCVGALLLAAHSLVDFDTSYPSLFAMLGMLVALGRAEIVSGDATPVPERLRFRAAAVGVLGALALAAVPAAWHGGFPLNVHVPGGAHVIGDTR